MGVRRQLRRRLVASVAGCLMLVAAVGCSGGSTQTGPPIKPLLKKAKLQPCPATVTAAASGGMPNLTFPCIGNGPSVHLAGLRGMPTVVNFYGTWCYPCQKESGYLSRVAGAAAGKVRFLGVDVGDHNWDALSFAAAVDPPAHYALVADPNALGVQKFSAGPPATVFVDSAGKVVGTHAGPYSSVAALRADIRRYFGAAA